MRLPPVRSDSSIAAHLNATIRVYYNFFRHGSLLDVDCATGASTADVAKIVGRGGMTVGLERDDSNLAIAEQRHSMSTI